MNNGSGPIKKPVRIIAAALAIYLAAGGILLAFGSLSAHVWLAALNALAGLWLGCLFLRAAITGSSPAWPD